MVSLVAALLLPLLAESLPVSTDVYPVDCAELYGNGHTLSGVYTIYPAGPDSPVQVYCDMGCEGVHGEERKWTVIHRRMDGTVNFYRPWDQYKKGFGNKDGEYWLGLENIYQLTRRKKYELRVDMEDFEGGMVHAQYSSFSIDSETEGYRLHVSGYTDGGAGNSLITHNGQKFSTFDRDQDTHSTLNCARSFLGAFWYSNCHDTNPNGVYLWGSDGTHYAIGVEWSSWKGRSYSLKKISMKIRPVP
ncbi:microfibril-associated glycoprotein 4 [Chanos chanos]|uniref:Microfibril-associated glycoprotein 4 n=1 Tax=Chanos chanos TaxID=29144 RepID=A0A6J2VR33_CHACN|nr:microfibril-associated glycoprotein 4-like [Chanos chanos]